MAPALPRQGGGGAARIGICGPPGAGRLGAGPAAARPTRPQLQIHFKSFQSFLIHFKFILNHLKPF